MCTGRIEPEFIIRAFETGADGVVVLGCHPGDCHYKQGNYNALRRFHLLRRMLTQFGIDEKRLRLEWISSCEADKFVETLHDAVRAIRVLGPLRREIAHAAGSRA